MISNAEAINGYIFSFARLSEVALKNVAWQDLSIDTSPSISTEPLASP
jgi:hypothetical protein